MRLAGIATMGEVGWALLEPNGKMSFIRQGADAGTDSANRQADLV